MLEAPDRIVSELTSEIGAKPGIIQKRGRQPEGPLIDAIQENDRYQPLSCRVESSWALWWKREGESTPEGCRDDGEVRKHAWQLRLPRSMARASKGAAPGSDTRHACKLSECP